MLEIKNVSHRFGSRQVLENLSLSLAPSERLAIMGPSGCGKTTLLRIALGLIKSTEGEIENSFTRPGVVFQEPRLLSWLTALENVNLVLGDNKSGLEKAEMYLRQVGLGDDLNKLPKELSGGMQQRVSLARALAMEGDLLVLDEPFKAMDEALRRDMIELTGRSKAAILLVTHDEWEAAELGCRLLRLPGHNI